VSPSTGAAKTVVMPVRFCTAASGANSGMWRVLIVEDSPTVKAVLLDAFAQDTDFRVSACCESGMQATRLAQALKPDLITLDLVLPDIDGAQTIRNVMAHSPTRILVVSSRTDNKHSPLAIDALEAGALDVVAKNTLTTHRAQFLARCRALCEAPLPSQIGKSLPLGRPRSPMHLTSSSINVAALGFGPLPPRMVVIGASTGGPAALERLMSKWPKDFALPVVVAQHMTEGFSGDLVNWLSGRTKMSVRMAQDGELPKPGTVYFALDGHHMSFMPNGQLALEKAGSDALYSPSVDKLFHSAARVFSRAAIGVLLTGMGDDGAQGLKAMYTAGGRTVAQDKATSLVFGMPQMAIKLDAARVVLPLNEIALYLLDRGGRPKR